MILNFVRGRHVIFSPKIGCELPFLASSLPVLHSSESFAIFGAASCCPNSALDIGVVKDSCRKFEFAVSSDIASETV